MQRYRLRRHAARVPRRPKGSCGISERRRPGSENTGPDTRERSRPTRSSRSTRLHVSMAAGLHWAVTNEYSPDLLDGPSPYASPSNHPVQQPVRHREFAARAQISAPRHRHWSRSGWQWSWYACHSVQSTCQHRSIRSRQEPFRLVMRAGNRLAETGSGRPVSSAHCRGRLSSIVYVSLLSRLAGRLYAQQVNVDDCGDLLIRASLASHCLRNRERVAPIDA